MKSKQDVVDMERGKFQYSQLSYNVFATMINTKNSYKNVQRYSQMINSCM